MAALGSETVDRPRPRGVGASVAFSVLTGLASAVPIGRSSKRTGRMVAGVSAAAAGAAAAGVTAGAAAAEREAASSGAPAPPTARQVVGPAVVGTLAGAATFGVVVGSIAFDRRLEAALVRRGVRRPRIVLGVVSAVASFAMDRLDRRVQSSAQAR